MLVYQMRCFYLIGAFLVFVTCAAAQQAGGGIPAYLKKPLPKIDFDAKSLRPDTSILSGLNVDGSTINLQSDRTPSGSLTGAETIDADNFVIRKSRHRRIPYFGLSIQTPLN